MRMSKRSVLGVAAICLLSGFGCGGVPSESSHTTPPPTSSPANGPKPQPTTPNPEVKPQPPVTAEAIAFVKAYRTDYKAADTVYGGKTVTLSGTVERAEVLDGAGFVFLKGHEPGSTADCRLADKAELSKVKKGDSVNVKGVVRAGGTSPFVWDCEIVKE